jgi:ribose-phosphate pyrophosphokinase
VIALHAFDDGREQAERLAAALGQGWRPVEVHRFPDGESCVRVDARADEDAVVLRSLPDPNGRILELLFAADALRRRGARRLTLVAPYLAYMRQDAVFREGEAVSQRVVGGLLGRAFDRVLTVEAHLHRVARLDEVVPCEARSLSAAPVLAAVAAEEPEPLCLVGPDVESEPWVRTLAERLGWPFVVGRKRRHGDARVEVQIPRPPPDVAGALLVDDVVSSGATLAAAARALGDHGVGRVEALVVHALFGPGAAERLREAGVARVRSTDTVPHPTNALPVAPLLAEALRAAGEGRAA